MPPNIGLADAQRTGGAQILADLLADEYVLYTKTRNYHGNIVGPQFDTLRKFFEAQYHELNAIADDVVEGARALGAPAIGTLEEFVQHARLREHPGHYPDARVMLANLLADHEVVIQRVRVDLETCADDDHEMGTNDFLTGLMEQHEKMAWMFAFVASASV